MNKSKIAQAIANKLDQSKFTQADVRLVVEAFLDLAEAELFQSGAFSIPGLVKLSTKIVPARGEKKGRNPATGEPIMLPPRKAYYKVMAHIPSTLKQRAYNRDLPEG